MGLKILFLTPQLPDPPRQGAAMRNLNLIRETAKRHDVSLLSFVRETSEASPEILERLLKYCQRVEWTLVRPRKPAQRLFTLLTSRQPDLASRLISVDFAAKLRAILRATSYDIIQIEGLELIPYLPIIVAERSAERRPRLVFDAHNAEYLIQERAWQTALHQPRHWPVAVYSYLQTQRLRRFEGQTSRQVEATVAVSAQDARIIHQLAPERAAPLVLPNGVDLAYLDENTQDTTETVETTDLVFTGTLNYRPNIDALSWFVAEVWPLIRAAQPETTLAVVGRSPTAQVRALAGNGIIIKADVPDIRPYIKQATVYIVPMRIGGGVRLKVLEAMALGKPIVSTTLGVEGVSVAHEQEVILADEASAFKEAIILLLNDATRRAQLGEAARKVAESYDWSLLVPRLEEVYRQALGTVAE